MSRLLVLVLVLSVAPLDALQQHLHELRVAPHCPSLFVAIFTRREDVKRRSLVRRMWQDAVHSWGSHLTARFAVCDGAPVGELLTVQQSIAEEERSHKDLMHVDCEEGYLDGKLTAKVMASMHSYLDNFSDYELFMKIDDDTFVMPGSLCQHVQSCLEEESCSYVYAGVFTDGGGDGDINTFNRATPCRDAKSQWFEPRQKFSGNLYPVSAQGGPGYILSKQVVIRIVEDGIAAANLLNMEDKAVGLWVDELIQQGFKIDFVNVPGTNGYGKNSPYFLHHQQKWFVDYVQNGTINDYPYALHHHLDGDTIACLHATAQAGDPDRKVGSCFHKTAQDEAVAPCSDGLHGEH